jgi:hypothetical protein
MFDWSYSAAFRFDDAATNIYSALTLGFKITVNPLRFGDRKMLAPDNLSEGMAAPSVALFTTAQIDPAKLRRT